MGQLGFNGGNDGGGYFILDGEDVFKFAIVPLCPDVLVFDGVDELGVYPYPVPCPSDAALNHITHAEIFAHLPD